MTQLPSILQIFAMLSRHSAIIEVAHREGAVLMTDENQATIRTLHNNRILYAREDSQFGLTRTIREMLDDLTHKQSTFAIGGNIGDEVERMEKLLLETEEAASRGKHEDSERYAEELSQSLYEIREYVTQDILQFEQVMSSKFSDVSTIEEKMRQNEHYMERAKRMHIVVEKLNRVDLHEQFSSRLVEGPGEIYRKVITNSIDEWSNTLLSISRLFEQFMFSFRQISNQTRRMRAFGGFLREAGQSCLEEALRNADNCPALCRVKPVKVDIHLDLCSDRSRTRMGSIVNELKPIEPPKSKERKAGTKSSDNATVSIEEDLSAEDVFLSVFLGAVDASDEPISATKWAQETPDVIVSSFLEHVLTWSEISHDQDEHEVEYIEFGNAPDRRANIEIEDIRVCRAA